MKEVFDLLFNAENLRMLIILAVSVSGFVWLNAKTDRKFSAVDVKFAGVDAKIEAKFAAVDVRFAEMDAKIEAKFAAVDVRFAEMDTKFATMDAKFNEIKTNDLAHLTTAFKALTFVLKENNTITGEQQQYIDSAL